MTRALLNEAGEARLSAGSPWIFRGHVQQFPEGVQNGDLVEIASKTNKKSKGVQPLGWGFWSDGALCLRVITRTRKRPNLLAIVRERLRLAWNLRKRWCPEDEAFRWIHGESDLLPGFLADVYKNVVSCQFTCAGWLRMKDEIASEMEPYVPEGAVVLRPEGKGATSEGGTDPVILAGNLPDSGRVCARIGSLLQYIDVLGGQKTGTYLDTRSFPQVLRPRMQGASVLDAFSFQGHFGLHALLWGANRVLALEQSSVAIEIARANRVLNDLPDRMEWVEGNAFDRLRELERSGERFDAVVVDPPPFSPRAAQVDSAKRGYKELALRSFRLLKPSGTLAFFSCSHAFTRELLKETLEAAACDARVTPRIVHELHQSPDHPVLFGVPESEYLKGFVLEV